MESSEITLQDVVKLEREYVLAKRNISNCKVVNGYPIYSGQVTEFMRSLAGFKWGSRVYDPTATRSLVDQIEAASLVDCKSIFTACSRGERFANGHWISVLESDVIGQVIARMKTLLPQIESQP